MTDDSTTPQQSSDLPAPEWPPPSVPLPPPSAPLPPPVVATDSVPSPARRGPGWFGVVVVAAVVSLVVGSMAGLAGYLVGRNVDGQAAQGSIVRLPQSDTPAAPAAAGSVTGIVDAVLPSVVSILAEGSSESGSGSGFVLRKDGYILTNNHVVAVAGENGKLTVVFNDGTKVPGKVVGTNTSYDLAVVKVDRDDLPAMVLGNSDQASVGDSVIAIGAPLGLDGTVTTGIVSALDRPVTAGGTDDQSFINAIQTDAAINPGNSGGPLLDASGRVIGINSAIASVGAFGEAGNIGLGFAIPVNSAKRIAEEIIGTGSSKTTAIGVSLDTGYDGTGARIGAVNGGGPAEQGGLQAGDVIVGVDGRVIDDSTELVVAIRSHNPGEKVEIDYLRDGKEATALVTLGALDVQR